MRVGTTLSFALLLTLTGSGVSARAQQTGSPPDFLEVYQLVRTNVAGLSPAEVDRAALDGLLKTLQGRVSMVEGDKPAVDATNSLIRAEVLSGAIGYFRIVRVDEALVQEFRGAYDRLSRTNPLQGVVLDLRYAAGNDYQSSANFADLFVRKEQALLIWGDQQARSTAKAMITVPAAVLANRETAGAAEALAGILRSTGAALLLGAQTAGQALTTREFALSNGQRLRLAIAPVRMGDGTEFPASGLKPDITVEVSSADERAYYADAFTFRPKSNQIATAGAGVAAGTNGPTRRPRFGEAELVRERREGLSMDLETATSREEPVIYDPALARAVDLLKGLSVIRQAKP